MITYPTWLNLSSDMEKCPKCCSVLQLETKESLYVRECRACNLGVIARDCYCVTESVLEDFLSCPKCILCSECGVGDTRFSKICTDCVKKKAEEEKRKKFWYSSPAEKLRYYGKQKLIILARRKKLRGFSRMTVAQLHDALKTCINEEDFPIRE